MFGHVRFWDERDIDYTGVGDGHCQEWITNPLGKIELKIKIDVWIYLELNSVRFLIPFNIASFSLEHERIMLLYDNKYMGIK